MPEQGWKVISIPKDVYSQLTRIYQEKEAYYRTEMGIRSFSGFVTYYLSEALKAAAKNADVVTINDKNGM